MSQEAFNTQTELKEKLVLAAESETTTEQVVEVVNSFLNAQVYLPSVDKAGEDGSVSPLLLQDTDENPVMPLFTSPEAIPEEYKEPAPEVSVVTGAAVIQSVTDAGVVIDPGAEHQFPISMEQMAAIREQIISQMSDSEES